MNLTLTTSLTESTRHLRLSAASEISPNDCSVAVISETCMPVSWMRSDTAQTASI